MPTVNTERTSLLLGRPFVSRKRSTVCSSSLGSLSFTLRLSGRPKSFGSERGPSMPYRALFSFLISSSAV